MAESPLERRRVRRWTALRAKELRSTPGADWTERTLFFRFFLFLCVWKERKRERRVSVFFPHEDDDDEERARKKEDEKLLPSFFFLSYHPLTSRKG